MGQGISVLSFNRLFAVFRDHDPRVRRTRTSKVHEDSFSRVACVDLQRIDRSYFAQKRDEPAGASNHNAAVAHLFNCLLCLAISASTISAVSPARLTSAFQPIFASASLGSPSSTSTSPGRNRLRSTLVGSRVHRGILQLRLAKQRLHHTNIDAIFEQMRHKEMS